MKILKESKELLPISYITSFISKGWEEVGILKEELKAIKETFKENKKVEDCLNNLIDSYLICIGQMEELLDNKKYLEFPEEKELKEALTEEVKPDLEAIDIIKDKLDIQGDEETNEIIFSEKDQIEDPEAQKLTIEVNDEEFDVISSEIQSEEEIEDEESTKDKEEVREAFEYYCDFD